MPTVIPTSYVLTPQVSELMSRGTLFRYLTIEGRRRQALVNSQTGTGPLTASAGSGRGRQQSNGTAAVAALTAQGGTSGVAPVKLDSKQINASGPAPSTVVDLSSQNHPPLTVGL